MAFRRELLQEVGLFDEIYSPGYGEDSDYHFKALCAGYRSVLVGDCFIYHKSEASFSERRNELMQEIARFLIRDGAPFIGMSSRITTFSKR